MGVCVCYIDEAGCTGVLPTATSSIQPVLAITALFINHTEVHQLTKDFIALKMKFFPGVFSKINHDLDALMIEIKGAEIRKVLRNGNFRKARHRQKFLDAIFTLLDNRNVRLVSRIWVKGIGQRFDGRAVYTTTTQRIAAMFQSHLSTTGDHGVIIGDFRVPQSNAYIAHSVFTQKHKRGIRGDAFPSLVETATFGISDNHAGLQLADLITSAVIYPIATPVYCTGIVKNCHVHPRDATIRRRYKKRLKRLQFTTSIHGKTLFGITVNDPHRALTSYEIFR